MDDDELEPGMVEVHHEDGRVEQVPGELLSIEITAEMRERQALLAMAAERARQRVIEVFGGCVESPAAAVREALGRNDLGLVNENELAAMLGVAVSTLQSWRSVREGPAFVRAGRSVLYRTAAITEWLEQAETQTRDAVQPSDGRRKRR
jgi:predicted DNA-binding transcriptional regulator AlpA